MTIEQFSTLITAIAGFLGVLVWPAMLVFVIVLFRGPISGFLSNLGGLTFKAGGVEATLTRQAEAAALLGAAMQGKRDSGGDAGGDNATSVATILQKTAGRGMDERLRRAKVLWVDDNPQNNVLERQALEALGIQVALSASTDDALKYLSRESVDVVISDMGRGLDRRAGYSLLDALRKHGNHVPFLIYAGSSDPEHQDEARKRGASGLTNRPSELVDMVLSNLANRP